MKNLVTLEITERQARKLINVLNEASVQAELEIIKDKRRANESEHNTIELAEQLVPQIRKEIQNVN